MSSSEHQVPHIPVEIDKEKLKKAFDVSHFDINAVLRGIQLTLVGGEQICSRVQYITRGLGTDDRRYLQLTGLSRIPVSSHPSITDRPS